MFLQKYVNSRITFSFNTRYTIYPKKKMQNMKQKKDLKIQGNVKIGVAHVYMEILFIGHNDTLW